MQTMYLVQSVTDLSTTKGAATVDSAHGLLGHEATGKPQSLVVKLKWSPSSHDFEVSIPLTHKMYLSHAFSSATYNLKWV